MILEKDIVEIGQYNKTHGIGGEISATLSYEVDDISRFTTLISRMDGILVPFFVENARPKNNHTLLLKLEGVESEKQAKPFVNKAIYALRQEVGDADEVYCDFFVGFRIEDEDGKNLGTIVDIDDSTENALFIVDSGDKSFMIPVTEDFIVEIKEEEKVLVMALPKGLVEL